MQHRREFVAGFQPGLAQPGLADQQPVQQRTGLEHVGGGAHALARMFFVSVIVAMSGVSLLNQEPGRMP